MGKGAQEIVDGANLSGKIGGLSGRAASAVEVHEAAVKFCGGKGVKIRKVDGGMLYESADGTKTVRTGVKYGKSKATGSLVYEANFEINDGKGNVTSNYHVTIK